MAKFWLWLQTASKSTGALVKSRVSPAHCHSLLVCGCWCSVARLCPTLCHPRTAARQASLSATISQSTLKLMPIESVMPSNHLIFCRPLLLLPSIYPSIQGLFQLVGSSHQVVKVWELQFQHQSFQWIPLPPLLWLVPPLGVAKYT